MKIVLLYFSAIVVLRVCLIGQDAQQNVDVSGHNRSAHTTEHMHEMNMAKVASPLPSFHAASGSNWQPASVPAHLWMTQQAAWDLMAHGSLFLTYDHQGGPRGEGKAESANYLMLMEQLRIQAKSPTETTEFLSSILKET